MPQPVLLSAVGWRADLVTAVVERVKPRTVELVHSTHENTREILEEVKSELARQRVPFTAVEVADFDFFAWSRAFEDALTRHEGENRVVNLTAGHGVAIATLASAAARHGLDAVCYDWEDTKAFHDSSPAAPINLDRLRSEDHALLARLRTGATNVKTLAAETKRDSSSVSVSLNRLVGWGFLRRESKGRETFYDLRPGVAEFYDGMRA